MMAGYNFLLTSLEVMRTTYKKAMEYKKANLKSEEQATQHLLTKMKYNLGVSICSKLMQQLKDSKDRVTFIVGKSQQSFPAVIVRSMTNVKSNIVHLADKYSIDEIKTIFDIVINLKDYRCNGLFNDYSDWKPITSIVNMIELSEELGMPEVEQFLRNLPQLFTEHNKNAFSTEIKRRSEASTRNESISGEQENATVPQENGRSRTKSRKRSLSKLLHRSLSRGRKNNKI